MSRAGAHSAGRRGVRPGIRSGADRDWRRRAAASPSYQPELRRRLAWSRRGSDLISAFSLFELHLLREDLERAIAGHTGRERVVALLQFLADFYGSYQMRALVEIEPGLVIGQMSKALPALVELIAPTLQGQVSDPQVVAMALVRLAVCHYLVPGYDDDRLIDQLRAAARVR